MIWLEHMGMCLCVGGSGRELFRKDRCVESKEGLSSRKKRE
jgi:hypothetical protein